MRRISVVHCVSLVLLAAAPLGCSRNNSVGGLDRPHRPE